MSLIKQAEERILKNRQTAVHTAEKNYFLALKDREFAENENKLSSLIIISAKEEAFGKVNPLTLQHLKQAEDQKLKILNRLNINIDSLIPKYNCSNCSDSGYQSGIACVCLKHTINDIISEQYGVTKDLLYSFEQSEPSKNKTLQDCLGEKYNKMKTYCKLFPENKVKTLVFSGPSGTGKSRLAMCMASKLRERGYTALILPAFKLNEVFLKYHTDFKGDGRTYLENLNNVDMLIIDDLGTETTLKNVTHEYLLQIISDRMMSGRHTLISTNLDSENIRTRYDDRMHSRLTDKKLAFTFTFNSCDLRHLKD